jgi:hypothetical protein
MCHILIQRKVGPGKDIMFLREKLQYFHKKSSQSPYSVTAVAYQQSTTILSALELWVVILLLSLGCDCKLGICVRNSGYAVSFNRYKS